ncbi:unnamed protein product [Leptosia nina]|uniref:MYND-type domain-containing protein n=1 Tax=Leptosia nina TaxID=320188 RepID=A0AAV1JE29_9NEOP
MNTKKSKHKRAKPVQFSTEKVVQVNEKVDEPKIEEQVINDDKVVTDKTTVVDVPVTDETFVQQDTPVKPKRKKTKKKKQDVRDDNKTPEISNEKESATNIEVVSAPDEICNIKSDIEKEEKNIPKKKKNKKKPVTPESLEVPQNIIIANVIPIYENICDDQEKSSKKKHKKKKPTCKAEDVMCISAFQDLLEPQNSQERSYLTDGSSNEVVNLDKKDEILLESVQTSTKKKDKKHASVENLCEADITLVKDISLPVETLLSQEEKNLTKDREEIDKLSPKPKAKIAKPVDKKRKDKKSQNILEAEIENSSQQNKNNNVIMTQISETCTDNKPIGESDNIAASTIDITISDETSDTLDLNRAIELEHSQVDTEIENNQFTEVRPSRKKKKSEKNVNSSNIKEKSVPVDKGGKEGFDGATNVSSSIEFGFKDKDSNIMPDFIQCPRSSSQQQSDNNNNMVIREITSPEEVRLEIPVLMSVPVIQGSGESPEVQLKMDPLDIEVTELNSITSDICKQFKTVNDYQEMDELKLSIEKSLTELTAIEKSELEAEKKFEEVLAYNLEHLNESKSVTEENLPFLLNERETTSKEENKGPEISNDSAVAPVCPTRKEKKSRLKKKGKQCLEATPNTSTTSTANVDQSKDNSNKKSEKCDKSNGSKTDQQEKGKQQSLSSDIDMGINSFQCEVVYEPIENFEDALTSSNENINDTFELIAQEANEVPIKQLSSLQKPEISITEPEDDKNKEKDFRKHPISQPKNLLGHPKIPVQSNKTDYKKEKNKPPNSISAKVKIKDANEVEKAKGCKETQTKSKLIKGTQESCTYKTNETNDFLYKYSFRKVFLPNICNACKKELDQRVVCKFCNLVFYCSQKHKDEDWPQHQFLCFAVCTIAHLKEQKFIYGNTKNIIGQEYRILRMRIIMACEKMLKRKLVPWEQEALLYARICSNSGCREWKQSLLTDCKGCGQVAFCSDYPEHLPVSHQRWCNSYGLYQKLVSYQQKQGRIEPPMPKKVITDNYQLPEKLKDALADLYEENIDMSDIEYAALTQIATAPLTTIHSFQISKKNTNGISKKTTFTVHIVGAELQFEADVLNKWELFFLHLRPDVKDLRVVLISPDLNPSNLPLDLLGKVKLCDECRLSERRLLFNFIDKKTYQEYNKSEEFIYPDIVCAFNPSIERATIHNGKDHWPSTLTCMSKLTCPLLITAYTMNELIRDVSRIKALSNYNVISEPKLNAFASTRPDRNFITDDEMPLLFKNYCYSVLCGF